ncbi:MAG: nucleotidyltransferase domain-containing protein [Synechococcales cyanobacterium CRU_2_2]|nr:nucleotidyltransferase domain-containing protein [Synechococcales cyanobacterium CRU_2_2]
MVQLQYVDYWRSQRTKQRRRQQTIMRDAWHDVQRIATLLKRDFGATQIILFGSLLSNCFHNQSDLDIAVAGLSSKQYWEALTAVNRLSQRWVDLKPLESLEPQFRDRVLARGQAIDATN